MEIQPGTYKFGPSNGTLSVRTERTGAAAKAGHNLLLHVTSWEATLAVGDEPSETTVDLTADATSLRVREGRGGMQTLGADDMASIEKTIDDDVLKRQDIRFHSTHVQSTDDGNELSVQGELTLFGRVHPLTFALALDDAGRLVATAVVKQSDWGMKPYSTLFGALKVVDEVQVGIDAGLPAGRFQRGRRRAVS